VATPKKKLVTIEEGTLAALAANPVALREFPFLGALNRRGGGKSCKPCNRRRAEATGFGPAKKTIAGLDSTKKRKLKEILNAEQVRVLYKDGSGRVVQLTF
jgi:hypothetical protein